MSASTNNSSNIPCPINEIIKGNSSGTGFNSIPFSQTPTAFTVPVWDAAANLAANAFAAGYATTVTAAGTTSLTYASAQQQYFTGSLGQILVLPIESSLIQGMSFEVVNKSSGVVTVQSSGGNVIQAMAADTQLVLTVIDTSVTTAAAWNAVYLSTGGSGSIVLSGDSGSATGSSLLLTGLDGGNNSGSTVNFSASGTTVALNFTDSNDNTFLGKSAGNLSASGAGNTGVGKQTLQNITSGQSNTAIGNGAGDFLLSGSNNLLLGEFAGASLTSNESSNIYLNNSGSVTEQHTCRIGYNTGTGAKELNRTFIHGINGVNLGSGQSIVTIDPVYSQLGTVPLLRSTTSVVANPYSIASDDVFVLVDTTTEAAPSSMILPASAIDGQVFTVKDASGDAGSFPITVTVSGGALIDGQASYVIAEGYQSVSFCYSSATSLYSIVYDFEKTLSSMFPWTDVSSSLFATAPNNGYFVTAAIILTLPASPIQGDRIDVSIATASSVDVLANTGQFIRIGSSLSSSSGAATCSAIGDSLSLIYHAATTSWVNVGAPQGVWTLS